MRHVLLLVAVPAVTAAAVAAWALAGDGPGQDAARDACTAYANTGRHQVATTVEEADEIRAAAQADADRAAAADRSWRALRRDIGDAFAAQEALPTATAGEVDAYFAADRRVAADCADAGADIGPLQP